MWRVAIFRCLKTELHALSRLDVAVPAKVGRYIRIGTGDSSVPAASEARAVGVGPTDVPSADRGGTVIGNTDRTGKAIAPFIGNDVNTISTRGD